MTFSLLQFLIRLALKRPYKRYLRSLEQPLATQELTLEEILNTLTPPFKGRTVADFKKLIPIQTYQDHLKSIYRVDPQDILFSESTSGTTSGKKEIPYTKKLLNSFSQMFSFWVYDTLTYGPSLKTGKLYFCITPQFSSSSDEENALNDDSDYISGPLKYLFNYLSICPPTLKHLRNPDDFYHILSLFLIKETKLEIISIWSPTFLLEVLKYIQNSQTKLLEDLDKNEITIKDITFKLPRIKASRRHELREAKLATKVLFPNLKLVSCWGGVHAQSSLRELTQLIPQAIIQEKGLLATEAPLTFPLYQTKSQVPLINEVFFEFRENPSEQETLLIHELVENTEYEVIISQKSGLLRYKLNDYVKVDGKYGATPTFKFIGRTQETSDLVGEKLTARFVAKILRESVQTHAILLPVKKESERPYYLLLSQVSLCAKEIEEKLKENPHYSNARALNQLGPLENLVVSDIANLLHQYREQIYGQSIGDQKDSVLLYRETNGKFLEYIREAGQDHL